MFPTPIARAPFPWRVTYRVAVPVALFIWLLPLLAVMLTSVRTLRDINAGNFWGWPTQWQLTENYLGVFRDTPMARFLFNSLCVTVPTVVGALTISLLSGYALARFRFRGSTLLLALFIAGNFIPFQILMIPVRNLTINVFHVGDSIWGLILFHTAFQAGFCTLFMRNFIRALPTSLFEAATIEGAGEFQVFWRIVLPLVRPATAALAVLVFTFVWNDFFWSLVLVQSDEVRPVTAALQSLQGMWTAAWQLVSAGSIIAAVPPVLMFFLMQRHFIAGLTMGATKE